MIRKSTAIWRGDALHGNGALTTQSGVFQEQPYSFKTRFQSEDGKAGTNPEELLAAAHAGCFAMAVSYALSEAGHPPGELRVSAGVDIANASGSYTIRSIALDLEARVPGIGEDRFQALAQGAKEACPLSRALAATPITLAARLAP